MRAFFLAYRQPAEKLSQPVTESRRSKSGRAVGRGQRPVLSQVVTESGDGPPKPVAEIPWGHNLVLLFKLKDAVERLWYAAKALEHGWSRAAFTVQIESGLYQRQAKAITNFAKTLPAPQSDLAQQSLKDPYLFDFLTPST